MESEEIQIRKSRISKTGLLYYGIFVTVFILTAVITVLIAAGKNDARPLQTVHFWNSVAMGSLLALVAFWGYKRRETYVRMTVITCASVVVTGLLFVLTGPVSIIPWFMIGALAISFTVDFTMGLFVGYFFLLQQHYFFGDRLRDLIILFVIVTLLHIFVLIIHDIFLKKKDEPETAAKEEEVSKHISYLESVASELDEKQVNDYDLSKSAYASEKEQQEKFLDLVSMNKESFEEYTSDQSKLLLDLRDNKKSAYFHSKKVALIAGNCAAALDMNVDLAKAIALHHEVGKGLPGEAAENTQKLLKDADVPETIITAVDQVNNKENLPFTSKEAFLVAVCDTVITTFIYLRSKTGADVSNKKIVDGAMTKYMLNGRADDSGISVKDCGEIKTFLTNVLDEMGSGK